MNSPTTNGPNQSLVTRLFIRFVLGIESGRFVLLSREYNEPWTQRSLTIISWWNQALGWFLVLFGTAVVITPYTLIRLGYHSWWLIALITVGGSFVGGFSHYLKRTITDEILVDRLYT